MSCSLDTVLLGYRCNERLDGIDVMASVLKNDKALRARREERIMQQ
jgi:hypothetical protein